MINIIKRIFFKILKELKIQLPYISKVNKRSPWVYVSYIPDALYMRNDAVWLNKHQSRREIAKIVDVFNDLGYNVYVNFYKNKRLPNITPQIIFGIEPSFEFACKKWPKAKKIYYATGAYWQHQNRMIKKRTDEFNAQHSTSYPYQRLVNETNRCEIADAIFQIGSKFTIETYPEHLRHKIHIIRQSNTLLQEVVINRDFASRTDFLWLGSTGPILKGLDYVIDFFEKHKEFTLHVCGPVEESFKAIYPKADNIKYYGFVNTSSCQFIEIAEKCNFLIYPSCTEGLPGSVINTMIYGIVPVVTRWAAFDDIEQCGILMDDLTCSATEKAILKAIEMPEMQFRHYSEKCKDYVKKNYSLESFYNDFRKSVEQHIL